MPPERFKPAGGRARWRVLYDLLCATETGEVLTYKDMAEALGVDPDADRQTLRSAMSRAAKEHQRVDKRSVEAITNEGYRVVAPERHLDLAAQHQQRASAQLEKGRARVEHTDLNKLDPAMRTLFENVVHAFAIQQEQIQRLDIKNQHLEQAVAAVDQKAERTETDMAGIEERLRRLERLQENRDRGAGE